MPVHRTFRRIERVVDPHAQQWVIENNIPASNIIGFEKQLTRDRRPKALLNDWIASNGYT
jgi:hypothetical protein